MSLRKLDLVCKRLDAESASLVREFYGATLNSRDGFHALPCTTKTGQDVRVSVYGTRTRTLIFCEPTRS